MSIEDLEPWLGLDEPERAGRVRLRRRLRNGPERTWLLRGERVIELALSTRRAMREAMQSGAGTRLLDQHTRVVLLQAETADLAQSFERTCLAHELNPDQHTFSTVVVEMCQELDRAGVAYAAWLARMADGSGEREHR